MRKPAAYSRRRITLPRVAVGWRLLKKHLGFRRLRDVIPLDPSLVKGSDGSLSTSPESSPVFICSESGSLSHTQRKEGLRPTEANQTLLTSSGHRELQVLSLDPSIAKIS